MPGPVGANPSLTIAALADRFADAMIEGAPGAEARPARRAGSAEGAPAGRRAGARAGAVRVRFTEEMKGHLDFAETDYERAHAAGKAAGRKLMFHLTITADDVERFIADRAARGDASRAGCECASLGGRRPVEGGHFNLFVDQDGDRRHKRMYYRLLLPRRGGPSAHARGLQGGARRPRVRRVDGHVDAVHARAGRHGGRRARSRRPRCWPPRILHILKRDFAQAAHDVPRRPAAARSTPSRASARCSRASLWETYGPLAAR